MAFHPDLIIEFRSDEYLWIYVGEDRGEPTFYFVGSANPDSIDAADLTLAGRDRARRNVGVPRRLSVIFDEQPDRRIARTLGDNDLAVDDLGEQYIWYGRDRHGHDTWHATTPATVDRLRTQRDALVSERRTSTIRTQASWEEGRRRFVTVPGTTPAPAPAVVDPLAAVRPVDDTANQRFNQQITAQRGNPNRCGTVTPHVPGTRGRNIEAGEYRCDRDAGHPGHHVHAGNWYPIVTWFDNGPALSMYHRDDAALAAYAAHTAAQTGQTVPTDPYVHVRPENTEPNRTVNIEIERVRTDRRCGAENPEHNGGPGNRLGARRYNCHREVGHPGHHIHRGGSWPILMWFDGGPSLSMYDDRGDAAWTAYEAHVAAQPAGAPVAPAHPDLYTPNGSRVFLYLCEHEGQSMYRSYSTTEETWQSLARITEYVQDTRRTGRYRGTGRSHQRIMQRWPDARPMTADDLPQDIVDDRGRVWLHVGYHEGPRYALTNLNRLASQANREAKRGELVGEAGGNVGRKWTASRIDREHTIRQRLPRTLAGVSGTPVAPVAPPDPVAEAKRAADAALAAIPTYQKKVRDKALEGRRTSHFRDDAALNKALGYLGLDIPKRKTRVPVTVYVDVDDAEDSSVAVQRAREVFEGVELPEGITRNRVNADRYAVETTFS
jgi:hypothetical protein